VIRAVAIAALFATALGCKNGSCEKRIATMGERLALTDGWSLNAGYDVGELIEVERSRANFASEPGMRIGVRHDGLVIEGRRYSLDLDDADLVRLVKVPAERMLDMRDSAAVVVLFTIDRRAPIELVRRIAGQLGPGFDLRSLVRIAGTLDIPPPPERVRKVSEAIRADDLAQRAVLAAREIEKAIGTCKPAMQIFAKMASFDPVAKASLVRNELPAAVQSCGCKTVDVPMLEELLLSLLNGRDPATGWVPLDRGKLAAANNTAELHRRDTPAP